MKNIKTLNSILKEYASDMDNAIVDYLDSPWLRAVMVRDARRAWLDWRLENGFKSYATLLTHPSDQMKLDKSSVYSVGLTLQHADVSGIETCSWRTDSCTATCVLDNGNGRYDGVQKARNVKTQFLAFDPVSFVVLLIDELNAVATVHGSVLCRLNVNSDVSWYRWIPSLFTRAAQTVLGDVSFYDYTKNPAVLRTDGLVADNYRLCYSLSERDRSLAKVSRFVQAGGTVAVVTVRKKSDVPVGVFRGLRVVDGDATDDRFHESGVWVDLSAKGKARALPVGGFVRNIGY